MTPASETPRSPSETPSTRGSSKGRRRGRLVRVKFAKLIEALPTGAVLWVSEAEYRTRKVVLLGEIVGGAETD